MTSRRLLFFGCYSAWVYTSGAQRLADCAQEAAAARRAADPSRAAAKLAMDRQRAARREAQVCVWLSTCSKFRTKVP